MQIVSATRGSSNDFKERPCLKGATGQASEETRSCVPRGAEVGRLAL